MRISNTSEANAGAIKALIYGNSGAGKTTLARTIKEPTIIISAESGLLSLRGSGIDYIDITLDDSGKVLPKESRIARLIEVYKYLLSAEAQKKYKWVFIDSLTEISQNLLEQLQLEMPDAKDTLKMYGENAKRMRALIKSFRDLPHYNVVFTALAEADKDELGQRYVGINMVGKISQSLPAFLDEVFYLHVEKQEDGSFKRVLFTSPTDKLTVKDRSGKLNKTEEPNLAMIAAKIKGVTTSGQEIKK